MKKRGLNISKKKTKIMVFSKKATPPSCKIKLDTEELEQVFSFDYLGSLITCDGRCLRDIKRQIALAKKAFNSKMTILTNKKISLETKKRFLRTYVWSILLYGCESWTISKQAQNHLEAAEMWLYRRILRIPWIRKETNEEVLNKIQEEKRIMKVIRERQLRFVGHIKRERTVWKVYAWKAKSKERKVEADQGRVIWMG